MRGELKTHLGSRNKARAQSSYLKMRRDIDIRSVRKDRHRAYVLADLFRAVRMASKNEGETIAAIADLLDRDLVRFVTAGREVRVRMCQTRISILTVNRCSLAVVS